MKPFHETERYTRWINEENETERSYGLSKICYIYFRDLIEQYESQRSKQIEYRRGRRHYEKNKKHILKRAISWAKRARNSKKHINLKWILEKSNPNSKNGTVDVPSHLNKQTGYICCSIWGKTYGLHRLVWMKANNKFIPEGLEINHKDLNKTNNKIENLEVVTHKQNVQHYNKSK